MRVKSISAPIAVLGILIKKPRLQFEPASQAKCAPTAFRTILRILVLTASSISYIATCAFKGKEQIETKKIMDALFKILAIISLPYISIQFTKCVGFARCISTSVGSRRYDRFR
jgi:hypothetical protein